MILEMLYASFIALSLIAQPSSGFHLGPFGGQGANLFGATLIVTKKFQYHDQVDCSSMEQYALGCQSSLSPMKLQSFGSRIKFPFIH